MLLPTITTSSLLALFQSTQENPIVRSIQTTSDFSLKILPLPFSSYPTKEISSPFIFLHILFAVYLAGAIYKSAQLIMSLSFLAKLRRKSILTSTNHYYKTYTQSIQPTFSFGKSIFLHTDSDKLSSEELDQVLLHEQTHIRQYHSVDIMLFEIAAIVFWFNPCLKYLSDALRKTHEYLVDRHVSAIGNSTVSYGALLIKLATKTSGVSAIHTFSDSQIFNRIKMLTKPKTNPMQKIRFFTIVPMLAVIIMTVIFVEGCKPGDDEVSGSSALLTKFRTDEKTIASISWEGNTKYSDEELTELLSIKTGDPYDSVQLQNRLYSTPLDDNPIGKDIVSRYMDEGHIFFRVEPTVITHGDKVDLVIQVYEGKKSIIGKVIIKGVKNTTTNKVEELIAIAEGEAFSRLALIRAQKRLSKSGWFNPDSININPIIRGNYTDDKIVITDIEFEVKEL